MISGLINYYHKLRMGAYAMYGIVLGALAFGLYRGVNRQKEIFDSYRLTLDNNAITREQHKTPTITISNTDVIEIVKNSNGSFTIKGNSPVNVIGVPSQKDD